jgi:thiamine transporter
MLSFIKNLIPSLVANLKEVSAHPTSIVALVGVLILIVAFIRIRKVKITTKMITQIGLALALSAVLQMFKIYHSPQGGSVTLGSLVPILIIALVYGPEVGLIAGFLHGMLTLVLDPYIVHPVQFLFDYPLASMSLGLAGYFQNNKLLGVIVAVFMKFICHFISGAVFFGSFAVKGQSAIAYSLIYNSTMFFEGAICLIIVAILPIKMLSKMLKTDSTLAH